MNGWLTNQPVGEWEGVVTDHHGRVIVLELWRNGSGFDDLVGRIPPELAQSHEPPNRWNSVGTN